MMRRRVILGSECVFLLYPVSFRISYDVLRVKHCLGTDYVLSIQSMHRQQGSSPNRKVSCSRPFDISEYRSCTGNLCSQPQPLSVQPRLNDPSTEMIYVTQTELLNALKMTVLGTSSIFHTWDASKERFVQAGIEEGKQGFLLVDGKDEVVSQR
jgi:hypothetical protein